MFYFSKSKYTGFCQCPKISWMQKYMPEKAVTDEAALERMKTGNAVGDLAMGLFGDFTEVTSRKEDGTLDLSEMIKRTEEELRKGTEVICEASFSFNGAYCAVDILKRDGDGYLLYEVKSSGHLNEVYLKDVAYQKYVLDKNKIKVNGAYVVCINKEYVFDGKLDIKGLFSINEVTDLIDQYYNMVEDNLKAAEELLEKEEEPDIDIGIHCEKPYECAFCSYCRKDLPEYSVFDLYRFNNKKKYELYNMGKASLEDAMGAGYIKSGNNMIQYDCMINNSGPHIERDKIRNFLSELTYPLYFLDFETMMLTVPRYVGTKPFDQIPFQYSLHYIEKEGGELKHMEYLGEPESDPRAGLVKQICEDIPRDSCVIVYNKKFEFERLKEMACAFPEYSDNLLNIADNIKDIMEPFTSFWYYKKEMGSTLSIKSVLPALFPDDPSLDYHSLEGVHHGGEAMTVFPAMEFMDKEERERTRKNLLDYCCLDTYATVKLWEELKRVAYE